MVVFDVVVVVAVVVVIVVVVVVIVLTVLEIVHIQFSTCKCSMVIMIQLVFFHSFATKSNFDAFENSLSRIITQVVEVHLDLFGGDKHCSID